MFMICRVLDSVESVCLFDFCLDQFQNMLHIPGIQRMEESHILALSILLTIHDKGVTRSACWCTGEASQLFAVSSFSDVGFHAVREAVQNIRMRTDVLRINAHLVLSFPDRIARANRLIAVLL